MIRGISEIRVRVIKQTNDSVLQDVLCRFVTLLRVVPQHPERLVTDSLECQHVATLTARHQHRRDERLTRLRLTRYRHQFAPRETRLTIQVEQEFHRLQLLLRRNPQLLQQ